MGELKPLCLGGVGLKYGTDHCFAAARGEWWGFTNVTQKVVGILGICKCQYVVMAARDGGWGMGDGGWGGGWAVGSRGGNGCISLIPSQVAM